MFKKKELLFSACSFALLLAGNQAAAQSVDYGTLEEIFEEPVTEGATGTPKRASDVPINMTIITAAEIRNSGARDIPTLLRRQAGLDVQNITQLGNTVSIRGRNTDGMRLRVLINGRDTFRAYEGTTVWAALPVTMEEIRQIEVVRGPATALYGANAVTGVVNIITFSPLHDDADSITARMGNGGILELSEVTTFKQEDVGGVRISGGYVRMNRFDAPISTGEALARAAKPENKKFSADGLLNLTDTLKLGAEFTYFEGDIITSQWLGNAVSGASKDESLHLNLAYESGFGRWTLQAFKNNVEENRNSVFDFGDGEFVFTQSLEAKTEYIDLTNAQSVGDSTTVRFSVGYRDDSTLQFGGTAIDGTGRVGYKTKYISGLADHAISDALSVTVSLRYDSLASYKNSDEPFLSDNIPWTNSDFGTFNETSANIGFSYKATENDTVKLMYARGFQAPSLFELGGQIIPGVIFPGLRGIAGNPNTKSAIYSQYEMQYLRNLPETNGKLSLSAYYRDENDLIGRTVSGVIYPGPTGEFFNSSANIADAKTWGIELDVSGKNENGFNWAFRYGFADTKGTEDLNNQLVLADFYPIVREYFDDRSSKHIATGVLGYEKGKVSIDAMIQYKSGYTNYSNFIHLPGIIDPFVTLKGSWTGNLALNYEMTEGISASFVGEGLLNKTKQEQVSTQFVTNRRFWMGLNVSF